MKLQNIQIKINNNKSNNCSHLVIPFILNKKLNLEKKVSCCLDYSKNKFNKSILKKLQSIFIKDDDNSQIKDCYLQINPEEICNVIFVPINKNNCSNLEEKCRLVGSDTYYYIESNKYKKIVISLTEDKKINESFLEGVLLSSYHFDKYKKEKSNKLVLELNFPKQPEENKKIIKDLLIKTESVFLTRDLVNEPNNKLSVSSFISRIQDEIKTNNLPIKTTILDENQLKKIGMNLLVSVGEGSTADYKSKLMIMEYSPRNTKSKKTKKKSSSLSKKSSIKKNIKKPDYVLLGKGVIFDTGGINLKTYPGVHEMKSDMAGAAVVSSFILGYSKIKGKQKVIGMLPLAQNAIGNKATISGDVIKAYNGKTVEIINTDAEGRLLLADCLSYASEEYPNAKLIDFATLTGQQENLSCKIFSNVVSNHLPLEKEIIKAGKLSQEMVVSLPYMKEDCLKYLESDTADLRNVAKKCRGQILTSSVFLGEFIKKTTKWAHLDIAGPTWEMSSIKPYMPGEGSGYGVRLLFKML